jgi:hypothetical protein
MATIALPTWTVDGWAGNTIDVYGVSWVVTKDAGWFGGLGVRRSDADKPASHGIYTTPPLRTSRVITLEGGCFATSPSASEAALDRINAVLSDGALKTLTVVGLTATRLAAVNLGSVQAERISPLAFDWQLSMVADDPRKLSSVASTNSVGLPSSGSGGVLWNGPAGSTGTPWNGPAGSTGVAWAATGTNGQMVLDNTAGTAPADVLFTITDSGGALANPKITRLDTGQALAYGTTLAQGDTLTLDTGSGAALLNGINRGALLTQADFFQIPPRATITVGFTAGSSDSTALLAAQWRVSYY